MAAYGVQAWAPRWDVTFYPGEGVIRGGAHGWPYQGPAVLLDLAHSLTGVLKIGC